MKKLLFTLLLATGIFTGTSAQHCPFDMASISVVRPINADSQVVQGLKIYFLNDNDEVVTTHYYRNGNWEQDTLFMHPNPEQTTCCGLIDNNNPLEPAKFRFWFAEDNYVILNGIREETAKLVIEDPLGRYARRELDIRNTQDLQQYPLCTAFSSWDLSERQERRFVKGYHPLMVRLEGR